MRNTRLVDKQKAVLAVVPVSVAIGAVTPVEVDGTGYDRCLWTIVCGAAGAGAATVSVKIQDAATSGGALADLPNAASAGLTKAAHASKLALQIDAPVNPARPFMKITAAVGTEAIVVGAIAQLYKANASAGKGYPVAASAVETVNV